MGDKPDTMVESVEFLSIKIGLVIVVVGGMHFFNMSWLVKFRQSKLFNVLVPQGGNLSEAPPAARKPAWPSKVAPENLTPAETT